MTSMQKWFLAFNAVGGLLVIGSYVLGIQTHTSPTDKLWGATSAAIRPWYTLSMLFAAAGYFAFLYHLALKVDPASVALPGGFPTFFAVFALILIPSALWMSLTFHYAENPGAWAWFALRAVLFLVALGSVSLVACLWMIRPSPLTTSWVAAVIGAAVFAFHTTVLDAFLWPILYRG